MPEQYQIILITGGFTLLGVIFGGVIPFLIEIFRRRWIVSDRKYDRKKEVLDRRCDQAEVYTQAATENFAHIAHDVQLYLFDTDGQRAIERNKARQQWVDQFDTKIYALGPSIGSLGDEELKNIFSKMMDKMDELKAVHIKASRFRFEGDATIDPVSLNQIVQEIWSEYSKLQGYFYRRLDIIRNTSLE